MSQPPATVDDSSLAADAAHAHLTPLFAEFEAALQRGTSMHAVQAEFAPRVIAALQQPGLTLGAAVTETESAVSGAVSDVTALFKALTTEAAAALPKLPGGEKAPKDWPPMPDLNPLGVPIGMNPFPNPLQTPDSVAAVQQLVRDARAAGRKVRVIGAAHSRPKEIIADGTPGLVLVSLTKYRGVVIDKEKNIAHVKAGTNLGRDPNNKDSTDENALCEILDNAGYAIPETGGIIHQTMGGFLATGSAGGSFKYSFHDAVLSYTVVDGAGDVRTFSRSDTSDAHYAACAVAAGLCGIITDVTISLEPRFYVKGKQETWSVSSAGQPSGLPVNLFGDPKVKGVPELAEFFDGVDHCRMMYWPQTYLPPRCQIWQGDRAPTTGPIEEYKELEVPLQVAGALVLQVIHNWLVRGWTWLVNMFAGKLLNYFVPLGDLKAFNDTWWKLLPMDNGIVDGLLPTCFTELWVDKADTTRAMQVMLKLLTTDVGAQGNYFSELYMAKKSQFWLSPSFSADKVRIDTNWDMYNTLLGNWKQPYLSPVSFFAKYWDALDKAGIHFTSHMGKYRPENHATKEQLRKDYPKYDEWLAIRKEMDPAGVFLTEYWAKILCVDNV